MNADRLARDAVVDALARAGDGIAVVSVNSVAARLSDEAAARVERIRTEQARAKTRARLKAAPLPGSVEAAALKIAAAA